MQGAVRSCAVGSTVQRVMVRSLAAALVAAGVYLATGAAPAGATSTPVESTASVAPRLQGGSGAISDVLEVAAGDNHTCAIVASGQVRCWGDNSSGQLGNGTTVSSPVPVAVAGLTGPATRVESGNNFTCAIVGGEVRCWGGNGSGQLGNGTTTPSTAPVAVSGLSGALDLTVGVTHACAIVAGGQVRCWGANGFGRLGNGTTTSSSTPVAVTGLSGATQVAAGETHTCAVVAGGQVRCWGRNTFGQLGNGAQLGGDPGPPAQSTPVAVPGFSGAVALDAGDSHNCVVIAGGQARCWGRNDNGQLGNGTTTSSSTPVSVTGVTQATKVGVGAAHSCVVSSSTTTASTTTTRCWGANREGQLGKGEFSGQAPFGISTAQQVTNLPLAVDITGGLEHTCAVVDSNPIQLGLQGSVRCWGANLLGQLGNDFRTFSPSPVAVTGLSGVSQLGTGAAHTCVGLSVGQVRCWGDNSSGQLGNNTTTESSNPVAVTGLSGAAQVAVGGFFNCALVAGGQARCWGDNTSGQLGNGTTTDSNTPVGVTGLSGATQIAARGIHACVLVPNGKVRCWGDNSSGQLGNGTTTNSSTTVAVTGLSGATQIAAGAFHTCAIVAGGQVRCWGDNFSGQLGNGTTTTSSTPVAVTGLSGATQISPGGDPFIAESHTCAIVTGGQVRCWGANASGQLGNGGTTDSNVPVAVTGLSGAIRISTGMVHSCALASTGQVRCWGDGTSGQLGDGSIGGRLVALVPVESASTIATPLKVVAGSAHSCALSTGSLISCWGDNRSKQLGSKSTGLTATATPGLVGFASNPQEVGPQPLDLAAGDSHSCAIVTGDQVRCWGSNSSGQLGNGTTTSSSTPVAVTGLSGATQIAAGAFHTCAIVAGGQVRCWGDNSSGQLGNGTTTISSTPVAVTGLSGATQIAAGDFHSCAIVAGGQVRCWGANSSGQLGNGGTTDRSTPVGATGVSGVTQIAAGASHTCAIGGGQVRCWGDNTFGQLGNGNTISPRANAVNVSSLTGATQIAAGAFHTCAIVAGGQVRCWGDNFSGQLGNGTAVVNSSTPVAVANLSGVSQLAAGGDHACALVDDTNLAVAGSQPGLRCWGSNLSGQLGGLTGSSVPTIVVGGTQ